jgi:hypothetical protein
MDPQRLSHMADGLLDLDEVQSVLYRATFQMERADALEIESLAHRLRTLLGWTEGEALHFLYKLGVKCLATET